METIIVHPKSKEQLTARKAIAKVLKVQFETEEASRKDIQNGKGVKIDVENLWK